MKIAIAYLPVEQEEAGAVLALLRLLYPKSKVRRDKSRPPHALLYLRTAPGDLRQLVPCDLCRYDSLSSCDGRPCSIDNAPTIPPESLVAHGRWVRTEDGDWECSNCKEATCICDSGKDRTYRKPFCPNCGARMDLEAPHAQA